jgi:hypothetical protein
VKDLSSITAAIRFLIADRDSLIALSCFSTRRDTPHCGFPPLAGAAALTGCA